MRSNEHILREISEGKQPSGFLADMIGYILLALGIWLAYTLGSTYLGAKARQLKHRKSPVVTETDRDYSMGLNTLREQMNRSTLVLKSQEITRRTL